MDEKSETKSSISETEHSKRTFHLAQTQYDNFFQNNNAIMFLIEPETGAIIDANACACHFYGYEYTELIKMNISQINTAPPEILSKVLQDVKNKMENHFVFNHRLANGQIKDVEISSGPIVLSDVTYLYSIIFDVTDRNRFAEEITELNRDLDQKVYQRTYELEEINAQLEEEIAERIRVEGELTQSMAEIRDLYENAPCGYHSVNADGVIIRINDTELKWLGYEREAVVNKKKITDFMTSESRETFKRTFPTLMHRGEIHDVEIEMIRKDGSRMFVLGSGTTIRDEKGKFLMSRSTVFDITRRKSAEQQLQQLNNELENKIAERTQDLEATNAELAQANEALDDRIIELKSAEISLENTQRIAHLGSWTWHKGELVWSENTYKIYGIEKSTVSGKLHDAIKAVVHPEDLAKYALTKMTAIVDKKPIEYRIIWPDQSVHYIWNKVGEIFFDATGNLVAYTGISQDVTERKMSELARVQAEAASHAKSTFLANMSHEIRTPINAIIGFNHLMQKTMLTDVQRDYVEKIMVSAQNLLGLVNDVLDFSKIEANKIALEYAVFDLFEVLYNVSTIVSFNLYQKKLRMSFELSPEIPQFIKGDAFRLNQILLNLINNAVKFTEIGEIGIRVSVEYKKLNEIELKFVVSDTGIGMTMEQQHHLFTAFTQVDMSTTRKHGGTGLGLSISKSFIDLMGGTIWVESQVEKGSKFIFTAKFEWGETFFRDDQFDHKLSGMKTKLVTLDEGMATLIESEFARMNLSFVRYAEVEEALQAIRQDEPIDLILVDERLFHVDVLNRIEAIIDETKQSKTLVRRISNFRTYELEQVVSENDKSGVIYYPMGQMQLYHKLGHAFKITKGATFEPLQKNTTTESILEAHLAILLVEDNETNQQLAKAILEDYGYLIDIAENGLVALEMIEEKRYQLVLMDLQMPVMDGFEAAKHIRRSSTSKNIPIIAMSAHALIGIKEDVLEAGMDDYITKPFDVEKMMQTIKQWIEV